MVSYLKYLFIFCLLFCSFKSLSEEKIKIGVHWGITILFFSQEIDELVAKEVLADSPADIAGLKVGDKVLSIEGCEIPGCSASKAREYLKLDSGAKLHLVVENLEGKTTDITITMG